MCGQKMMLNHCSKMYLFKRMRLNKALIKNKIVCKDKNYRNMTDDDVAALHWLV